MKHLPFFAQAHNRNGLLLEKAHEANEKSLFWLASLTKIITSFTALMLVDEGKLELDTPLNKILPHFKNLKVLENGMLRDVKQQVTLRHLLSHTSGFTYDTWSKDLVAHMKQEQIPPLATCKLSALNLPLISEPQTRFEYGVSIDYVGQAIEAVIGKKLHEVMQKKLFIPLDMQDTTFELNEIQNSLKIPMHSRNDDGTLKPMNFQTAINPEFEMGGGGLWGTASDYNKFLAMIMNGAKGYLSPRLFKQAITNQIGDFQVKFPPTTSFRAATNYQPLAGISKKWGLLAMINEQIVPDMRSNNSIGWAGLANCFYWIDFERQITGLFLSQIFPFGDEEAVKQFESFEKAVYALLK